MPAMFEIVVKILSPWVIAIRPKTLPAAAAPVIVGSALAYSAHSLDLIVALVCLLSALLLQIGSNLANDVFDYEKGADSGDRLGPIRATQSGLLSPGQVKGGMWLVFGLTAIVGVYLIFRGGWPILFLGIAAILSAIAYTGGPYPLGYHGFGDLFVFVFFGLGATTGTYYLQVGFIEPVVWWLASAMGCLTVSILVVNNLRDIENDRRVSKMTLAVRLGAKGAKIEYVLMLSAAYSIPLVTWKWGFLSPWGMLTWFSIPLTIHWIGFIYRHSGIALNKALAGTGQIELIYALLFTIGMVFSKLTGIG
jgi:1,4-dihydroxy-2-naphthoate octaprenyltransferase